MARRHKKIDGWSVIIIFSLIMVDAILWRVVVNGHGSQTARTYSFALTHSTSTLLVLPNNITVLFDAGTDDAILSKLDSVLSPINDHYIDLAIISSPQLHNYQGYNYILDHDAIGVFIYNGRNDPVDTKEWAALLQKIHAKHIPLITLGEGDTITYGATEIDVVAPDSDLVRSANITDTALVEVIKKK